jgi:hypothetical protein
MADKVEYRLTNLMSLALLFHCLLLNMFRILVHPSSGACDLLWIYFMCCICSVRIEVSALASLFSDIKLVYLYSAINMMHGPINLRLTKCSQVTVRLADGVTRSVVEAAIYMFSIYFVFWFSDKILLGSLVTVKFKY